MRRTNAGTSRRRFVATSGAVGLLSALAPFIGAMPAGAVPDGAIMRAIPSTGEPVPAIGMGTWITFNVGENEALRRERLAILEHFFRRGGAMIDSSPMYGTSEDVVGWCLERLDHPDGLISATKVWSPFGGDAREQLDRSLALWRSKRISVMQVHNLVDWEDHLDALRAEKEAGRVGYVGITTSHGRRHDDMERIMAREEIDFVQFTYNILDRVAEERLLPLAAERGLGVIVNRPFRRKDLFHRFQDKPLPDWAEEADIANWAQFFLKFVISHPAVTCAIPATSQLAHMKENMGALYGRLPGDAMRRRMVRYVENL